jgi:hypothetical protein
LRNSLSPRWSVVQLAKRGVEKLGSRMVIKVRGSACPGDIVASFVVVEACQLGSRVFVKVAVQSVAFMDEIAFHSPA